MGYWAMMGFGALAPWVAIAAFLAAPFWLEWIVLCVAFGWYAMG